jgi:hypothetical protein
VSGLAYLPLESTNQQVSLTWSLLETSQNGGSPISGYIVHFNDGVATTDTTLGPNQAAFTQIGLTGGNTYTFAISALNIYGAGTPSSTLTVIAA